jgi:hypothetical protein
MNPSDAPDLKRALRLVPNYERAVREVSRMLADAGIRHALVGHLPPTHIGTGLAPPLVSTSW